MVFFETSAFTRRITTLMGDDEYRLLQLAIIKNPEIGTVIPGAGGIQKVRWGASGRGKRG